MTLIDLDNNLSHKKYSADIDTCSKEEWTRILNMFSDANIFQTWGYGAKNWGEKKSSHLVLKRSNQIVAAAQLWVVSFPVVKSGFAHISWGPIWRRKEKAIDLENFIAMIKALHREYVLRRGLLLRIRFNEIDIEDNKIVIQALNKMEDKGIISRTNEYRYRTIIVDLNRSSEELRANLRKNWRRYLRKAEKNNLIISDGSSDEMFNIFCEIYGDMVSRKKFTKHLEDPYQYAALQKLLPEPDKLRIFLSQFEGQFVAGVVLSAQGDTGCSILGATSTFDISKKLNSAYLLDWHSMNWLRQKGYKYYDLRGYDPVGYPGPSRYKKGLGGEEVRFVGTYESCHNISSKIIVKLGQIMDQSRKNVTIISRKIRNKFG